MRKNKTVSAAQQPKKRYNEVDPLSEAVLSEIRREMRRLHTAVKCGGGFRILRKGVGRD
jgi:hypothetical protein